MKKFLAILVVFILLLSTLTFTASAEGDFKMKEFDKAYITFVFDDGNMPFTRECYYLFKAYNMPICCAVVAKNVDNNPELISVLREVEKTGGEVLSHTYTHSAFGKNSTVSDFEFQLKNSYVHLSGLGFKINGVIEAGNGGGEAEANYELMETVTRKYYKYSNAYGVSPQYKKKRTWFMYNNLNSVKVIIDEAIKNKEWVVFSAHSFSEFSQDDMSETLRYIKSKSQDEIAVVNWNYIYENFGEYTGPQVPTADALKAVENYKRELEKNSKPAQSKDDTNYTPDSDLYNSSYPGNNTHSSHSVTSNNNSVIKKPNVSNSNTNSVTNNVTSNTSDTANNTSVSHNSMVNGTTANVNTNAPNNTPNNNNGTSVKTDTDAKVDAVTSSENNTSSVSETVTKDETEKEKKSNNAIWLGVLIIGVVAVACALTIFFVLKFKK